MFLHHIVIFITCKENKSIKKLKVLLKSVESILWRWLFFISPLHQEKNNEELWEIQILVNTLIVALMDLSLSNTFDYISWSHSVVLLIHVNQTYLSFCLYEDRLVPSLSIKIQSSVMRAILVFFIGWNKHPVTIYYMPVVIIYMYNADTNIYMYNVYILIIRGENQSNMRITECCERIS